MDKFIFEIEKLAPSEICKDVIQKFESDVRKQPGEMSRGVDKSVKDCTDLYSNTYEDWQPLCKDITQHVLQGMVYYIDHLNASELNRNNMIESMFEGVKVSYPQIQKTSEGGFYDWHMDGRGQRMMTYILYLNDVEEDYGGTTDFSNGRSIIPKEGKLLLFPSSWSYIHTGKRLEKGFKYIATGFIIAPFGN